MTGIQELVQRRRDALSSRSGAKLRHAHNNELCDHFARIIIGRESGEAAESLTTHGDPPAAVYVLPVYWWSLTKINMGRKGLSAVVSDSNTVRIEGEGTWVADKTGRVVFTPEPGFDGHVTPIKCVVGRGKSARKIEVFVHDGESEGPKSQEKIRAEKTDAGLYVAEIQGPVVGGVLIRSRTPMTFPVRVNWDVPYVGVLEQGAEIRATGRVLGMGHDFTVNVTLSPEEADMTAALDREGMADGSVDDSAVGRDIPARIVGVSGQQDALRLLSSMKDSGKLHYFELLQAIESRVTMALPRIKESIALTIESETNVRCGRNIMDSEDDASVIRELVYGKDGCSIKECYVTREIENALLPEAFVKCDPQHRLHMSLKRDLRELVSRRIGDDRIGPKVRKIARELGKDATSNDVLREYRSQNPTASVGIDRIQKLLGVDFAPSMIPTVMWGDS